MTDDRRPTLSFGIPVRNGARFLRRLLESLEAQDFTDIEVIVSDNASTDETGAIAREFAERDPRFRYHPNETNIGQIENFNRVFELSCGRFFRWVGADDQLAPSYARACVEALGKNPDTVGVTTLWKYEDDEGNAEFVDYRGKRVTSRHRLSRMARMLWFLQADVGADPIYSALSSDKLRETGMLPIGPWTDRVLALELSMLGPFCHVHECLATRRNAREPAKVRLNRYHPRVSAKKATEKRLAPRWTMYRDLAAFVLEARHLGRAERATGTGLVVAFGALHHARVLREKLRHLAAASSIAPRGTNGHAVET